CAERRSVEAADTVDLAAKRGYSRLYVTLGNRRPGYPWTSYPRITIWVVLLNCSQVRIFVSATDGVELAVTQRESQAQARRWHRVFAIPVATQVGNRLTHKLSSEFTDALRS